MLSHVWLFVTPWTAAHQASLSITNSRSLPKLMSIESVMPSNHLMLCRSLLLLLSVFPSIRVFSNEGGEKTFLLPSQVWFLGNCELNWQKSYISSLMLIFLHDLETSQKRSEKPKKHLDLGTTWLPMAPWYRILLRMQETQEIRVQSLSREDPWSRKRPPTPVFLPG